MFRRHQVGDIATITDNLFTGTRSFLPMPAWQTGTYDDLNRLTEASGTFGTNQSQVTQDYTYNAIGNILTKAGISYSYNDPNHPSAVTDTSDGKSYSYDNNGNMTSGAGRMLFWDADNRLDSLTNGNGTVTMDYDYTGMRVKKTGSSGTTLYPFSGVEITFDNGAAMESGFPFLTILKTFLTDRDYQAYLERLAKYRVFAATAHESGLGILISFPRCPKGAAGTRIHGTQKAGVVE